MKAFLDCIEVYKNTHHIQLIQSELKMSPKSTRVNGDTEVVRASSGRLDRQLVNISCFCMWCAVNRRQVSACCRFLPIVADILVP